jgi:hypothetical protein
MQNSISTSTRKGHKQPHQSLCLDPSKVLNPTLPPTLGCRTIYNMCTQKPPHDYSEQLYAKYREAFNTYISDKVGAAALDELDPLTLYQALRSSSCRSCHPCERTGMRFC